MTDPILLLAMMAAGEAGPLTDAIPLLMHCALNRVADPRWPDTVVQVIEQPHQFNGRAEPTWLHLYWARQVLGRDHDPTGGVLFVLSGDDRRRLGCPVGDVIYVGWDWSLHGYREWCGG